MNTDITYKFQHKLNISGTDLAQLRKLGKNYEDDIEGIDSGFESMLVLGTEHIYSIHGPNDQMIGFMTTSNLGISSQFEGDKPVYITTAYLTQEYRNSSGQHQGVLNTALENLVDTLKTEKFTRLRLFPPSMFRTDWVTAVGQEKVLMPLYDILKKRKSETDSVVGDSFRTQYIFNFNEVLKKIEARKAKSSVE